MNGTSSIFLDCGAYGRAMFLNPFPITVMVAFAAGFFWKMVRVRR
jgi:hypothetical protein